MPVKGSRKLYKIPQIQVGAAADGTGGRPIIARIKEPIGNFLGLTAMPYNDPEFIGTFAGTGPNSGYKYIKRLGGFRYKSFTIVSKRRFIINEVRFDPLGVAIILPKLYASLSIGFPAGVTVRQFLNFLASTSILGQVDYVVTPSGSSFPLGPAGGATV